MSEKLLEPPALDGRVAIVTGASRGIGLAVAQRLVRDGARVCITARKQGPLAAAAETMPSGSVIMMAGKSDDAEHRREVVDRVAQEFGRIDILVNNAGINPVFGAAVDLDLAVVRKVLEVNVVSTLAWVQEVVRRADIGFAQGGCIVNLSSVTGDTPSPGLGIYGVSKAAVTHLTKTLAAELGPQIRVNAVAPAVVKTQFARALFEGKESATAEGYPMRRLGVPDDVASAVAYLVSDEASWVTGHVMTLDGGLCTVGGTA